MDSRIILPSPITDEVHLRVGNCFQTFYEKFEAEPQFLIRVPGRVNLIGEHIDYCGYGVFPMAVQQDVLLCLRTFPAKIKSEATLHLASTGREYPELKCKLEEISLLLAKRDTSMAPEWYLYFLCGVKGIMDRFNLLEGERRTSMHVLLDGVIPANAGLSSSSAIVCSAAIATLTANKLEMEKEAIASLCAKSERFVGTEGGGMDQAIQLLATKGAAQLIEFIPSLHVDRVDLPKGSVFVIANSLVEANKAANSSFNTRVAECRLATWVLAKGEGIEDFFKFEKLKDLQLALGLDPQGMKNLIDQLLHHGIYEPLEIADILGLSLNALSCRPLMSRIPFQMLTFALHSRAKHVVEEAERVHLFRKACMDGSLERMGKLMLESHWSLSKLYECSHPHLDMLVSISEGITYGARLTGAGWGGCVVALMEEKQLPNYLDTLKNKFYIPLHGHHILDPRHVFVTEPGPGASLYQILKNF